ncbi:MAG: pentapeptide repeat-containing protein [Fuerstiella sp.]
MDYPMGHWIHSSLKPSTRLLSMDNDLVSDSKKEEKSEQKRSVIASATNPTLLTGVSLGVALALVMQLTLHFGLGRQLLFIALLLSLVCLAGAITGYAIFAYHKKRLAASPLPENSKNVFEILTQLGEGVVSIATGSVDKESTQALLKTLQELKPKLIELASLFIGLAMRAIAIGRLAAILGLAVSLAIFLATFMQVEKLETQNSLLQFQNVLLETSNNLQEASRRVLLLDQLNMLSEELILYDKPVLGEDVALKITNLAADCRPYRYLQYDEPDFGKTVGSIPAEQNDAKLSKRALSPERSRILLLLLSLRMQPDALSALVDADADFSRSDFRGKRLNSLAFDHLILGYADFSNVRAYDVSFRNATLPFADFSGAQLLGADFSESEENVASLGRHYVTDLRQADFTNARLNVADFTGADLEGAKFSGAVLFDTKFSGARMAGIDLDDAAIWSAGSDEELLEGKEKATNLLSLLPTKERMHWTTYVRDPGSDHKYLGGANDATKYLFFKRTD